jgi:hypothetical protein
MDKAALAGIICKIVRRVSDMMLILWFANNVGDGSYFSTAHHRAVS